MRMRRRPVLIGALYLALALAFTSPLFAVPDGLGFQDWDVHLFFYGAVLKNLVEYGQLPFWNPWYCGGNVLLQNPQVALLSPVYPLAAVVSVPLAMKLTIAAHYWLAFVGMHLLIVRAIGLRFLPAVMFLASAFTFSGALAMHLAVGHANFLPAFYLPLQLFFFSRALESGALKYAVMAGAAFAAMVYNGGMHIVPMAVAVTGTVALIAAAARRDWHPVAMVGVSGVIGALVSAPKLFPMLFFVTGRQFFDARTQTGHPDLMTVEMFFGSLLDAYQTRGLKFDGQIHGWYEYGNYVGLLVVLGFAASAAWIASERRILNRWFGVSLAGAALVVFALAAGEFSSWAPASIATHVPLFSNFRIPSRYTVAAVLCASITIAWAASAMDAEGSLPAQARTVLALFCLLATADLMLRNGSQLRGSFAQAPIPARFKVLGGPPALVTDTTSDPYRPGSPMYRTLAGGASFYRCYEVMQSVHTADVAHDLVWTTGPTRIFETRFSPNRVEFSVVGGLEPSRVRLNQNFSPGWRSDAGAVVPDPETGQPSVMLTPGQAGKFSFTFVPPGLFLGLGAGLLGIAASIFGWRLAPFRPSVLRGQFSGRPA